MVNKHSLVVFISVTTAIILWGFSFIWTNMLLQIEVPVYTIVFFRIVIASIILTVVSLSIKRLQKIARKDIPWLLLLVLFEPFLYFIGETFGLKAVNSPTLGAIVIATIPIFSLIAGIWIYKEKISMLNIFGIAITLPGILLVMLENGWGNGAHLNGVILLFLAVFSATGYSVVVKRLASRYNSYTIVTYQNIIGLVYFLPLFLSYDFSSFSPEKFFTTEIILPVIALATLCSGLAFILFVNSIKVLGVARTNIFTSLIPAVSAYGAYMLGQESMSISKVAGIIIVISGVIIAQKEKKAISA
ncbi:MAG: DMT family transporter [Rikenellaceae bacterium]|nr:DMT family transporter [Rikenellaceae bacterium]